MHSFRPMNKTVGIKICGMTRADDVDLALALGADYLGFIVYAGSPRGLSLEHAIELASRVPEQRRVVVDVESSADDLQRYRDAGFAHFQVHTNLPIDEADLASRADIISRERLWLAPRVAPTDGFPVTALQYANTIVLDTYSAERVGGTGHTGDFERFSSLQAEHSGTQWILAGGLSPTNVVAAIERSNTECVDINSGVESAPGIKNPEKLRELFRVLRGE